MKGDNVDYVLVVDVSDNDKQTEIKYSLLIM